MATSPLFHDTAYHPYGLPMGTVRGFMSVLICSFFWIVLLLPEPQAVTAPLGHFFLLTLVFLAFASHPTRTDADGSPMLPWLMRVLFVGGSAAVIGFVIYTDAGRLGLRFTPRPSDVTQWPVLLATLSGGFGIGLFLRFAMGRMSTPFQTFRAWVGVLAILVLIAETIVQFLILPRMSVVPDTKIWEAVVIAVTAAYFGMRA